MAENIDDPLVSIAISFKRIADALEIRKEMAIETKRWVDEYNIREREKRARYEALPFWKKIFTLP